MPRTLSQFPDDLGEWERQYPATSLQSLSQRPLADQWLGDALMAFRSFRDGYALHFDDPVQGIIPTGRFNRAITTESHLRAQVIQALDDYWAPLSRVMEQRQIEHFRSVLDAGTDQAKALLSRRGVDVPILIYFEKVSLARHYPYANVVFIGTPRSRAIEGDWMAVPHEIGHYVYWHLGALPNVRRRHQDLRAKGIAPAVQTFAYADGSPEATALTNLFQAWLEEIYADVVGVWLAGELFVRSFQGIIEASAGSIADLKLDDGEHPPLIVRPFIRERALHLEGGSSGVDWAALFNQYGIQPVDTETLDVVLPQPAAGAPPTFSVTVAEMRGALEALVGAIHSQIEAVLANGLTLQSSTMLPTAFEQLRLLAELKDRPDDDMEPYEKLLEPQVLEGAERHSHYCTCHGKSHYIGSHPA